MARNAALQAIIERADSWPEYAQRQLAEVASEIEAELSAGTYHATEEELAGIRRGLRAADEGRFASDEEVEAVFAKHRRK
jgi:predicted transcriptional regulator